MRAHEGENARQTTKMRPRTLNSVKLWSAIKFKERENARKNSEIKLRVVLRLYFYILTFCALLTNSKGKYEQISVFSHIHFHCWTHFEQRHEIRLYLESFRKLHETNSYILCIQQIFCTFRGTLRLLRRRAFYICNTICSEVTTRPRQFLHFRDWLNGTGWLEM